MRPFYCTAVETRGRWAHNKRKVGARKPVVHASLMTFVLSRSATVV